MINVNQDWELRNARLMTPNDWPGETGGVIQNSEYAFNVAHDIVKNKQTNAVVWANLRPRAGTALPLQTPADLDALVEAIRAFVPTF